MSLSSFILVSSLIQPIGVPSISHEIFKNQLPVVLSTSVVDLSSSQYRGTLLESNDLEAGIVLSSKEQCIMNVRMMSYAMELSPSVVPKYRVPMDARVISYSSSSYLDGSHIVSVCIAHYNRMSNSYQYISRVRSYGVTD